MTDNMQWIRGTRNGTNKGRENASLGDLRGEPGKRGSERIARHSLSQIIYYEFLSV